jgi:hypothetical protein
LAAVKLLTCVFAVLFENVGNEVLKRYGFRGIHASPGQGEAAALEIGSVPEVRKKVTA